MQLVVITALGVGGATVFGAALGFLFKKVSHSLQDAVLGFAAGVMLAAAVLGLIVPSYAHALPHGVWLTVLGVLCGGLFLNFADRLTPHLHHITGMDQETHRGNASLNKVVLFVMAIAIHNLPEGLAAGVGFGAGDVGNALTVAAGIALQNIPEGMVIISPLLVAGVSGGRTFALAALTGVIEIIGTFLGYFAASFSAAVLPFALSFAGGTMLYIIMDEMIPETHSHGHERLATWSLTAGFLLILLMNAYIG